VEPCETTYGNVVKLIDPQNTHFGAKNLMGLILHLSGFIVNIVCLFADFSYHGNRS